MAASVVHFGEDICFRLPVLKRAGYSVTECNSVELLSRALYRNPDAVLLAEEPNVLIEKAVSLTRSYSTASLILFRAEMGPFVPGEFDLVIPSFTPPHQWLHDIAELLERCHANRARAQTLHQESAALRQDAAAIRAASSEERDRSQQERARMSRYSWEEDGKLDPRSD